MVHGPRGLLLPLLVLLLLAGTAPGAIRIVTESGTNCTSGDFSYRNFSVAINASSNGDEVIVCTGLYTENVTVNRSVTLRTNNTTYDVTINASGYTVNTTNDTVNITAPNVN
ncbi:MAG: hypothetical protein HY558_02480, partial [Euryarchaeota archaeon]|nr:hypothetical protein [Euryarchaeota archaeon]